MQRRYLYIALGILAVIGLGMLVYFFFFAGSSAGITVTPPGGTSLPVAGQGTAGTGTSGSTDTSGAAASPTAVSARLVKISAGPVVPGAAVVTRSGSASSSPVTAVSFIARESGNVFSYLTGTKTLTRTSNKTVPGIQSASWLPNASVAFVRYLSGENATTINTYALPANGAGGFFLSQNLADIDVSSSNVLTLASGVNGSTASLARTDGSRTSAVFSTPLSSLRVSFAGKSQYLAATKPSATLPGNVFLVSAAGRFSRIAGPLDGLVALPSPLGKWVLVSYTQGGALQMELVNAATGEVVPLPVATIAEKCVWAADDSVIYCGIPISPPAGFLYPDDWYQGALSFSDRLWKIHVAGRYAQLVLDFSKETEGSLDATALAVDSADTTLVFMNKNDDSLWSYQL